METRCKGVVEVWESHNILEYRHGVAWEGHGSVWKGRESMWEACRREVSAMLVLCGSTVSARWELSECSVGAAA